MSETLTTNKIDTKGWNHVMRKRWWKDQRLWEVWVSNDGDRWIMLGVETQKEAQVAEHRAH